MSDARNHPLVPVLGRYRPIVLVLTAVLGLSGCSLFVMAGKMIFDDPKAPSAFKNATGIDLAKKGKKVLVIVSTPEAVKTDFPSLDFDLIEGVTRGLKRSGIKIVSPDEVSSWIDDHGGMWDDPTEFADAFETDYIIYLDLEQFAYKEENSPELFRGRTVGNITAYEVKKKNGQNQALRVFASEYTSVYPRDYPQSATQVSAKSFRKRYLDRVSAEIARMFTSYRMSETIE